LFKKDSIAFEPVVLPPVPVKLRDSLFIQQFSEGKQGVDDWDSDGNLVELQSRSEAVKPSRNKSLVSAQAESSPGKPRRQTKPSTTLSAPSPPVVSKRSRSIPPPRLSFIRPHRERKDALLAGTSALGRGKRDIAARNRTGGTGKQMGPSRRINLSNGTLVDIYASMIVLENPDTGERNAISYPRLREMCHCDKCVDPSTKQRNFTLGHFVAEVKTAGWLDTIPESSQLYAEKDHLVVNWPSHTSRVTFRQLYRSTRPVSLTTHELTKTNRRKFWVKPDLLVNMMGQEDLCEESSLPLDVRVPYQSVFPTPGRTNKAAHTSLLARLHKYGIAILHDVPTVRTDNHDCTLREVAESIGPIRHTFYGETWNVKSMPESKNVAYTDVNLGLHMDRL